VFFVPAELMVSVILALVAEMAPLGELVVLAVVVPMAVANFPSLHN
jgi:hypothetical protein